MRRTQDSGMERNQRRVHLVQSTVCLPRGGIKARKLFDISMHTLVRT